MSLLSQALYSAHSADNTARSASLQVFDELSHSNPVGYLLDLSQELANPSASSQVRQLAGLLIKNLVINSTRDPRLNHIWQQIDPQVKSKIRSNTLGTLASEDKDVRLICSQTVATIACIDIPQGQWLDLLSILITNSTNLNLIFKVSAIRTLGYICEGLPQGILIKEQADSILTVLASSLDQIETNLEVKIVALNAFRNSLKFISSNMADNNERQVILNLLYGCCQNAQIEVRKEAMLILCDVLGLYYELLESNLIELGSLTYSIIKNDHHTVALYAVEFWNLAADEEVERSLNRKPIKKYIETAANTLVPLLLEKIHLVEEDGMEWSLHKACSTTLGSIALLIADNILGLVGSYISANLKSEDWQKRLSTVVIIGFIVEGVTSIESLVNYMLNDLLIMLNTDRHKSVVESIAWSISKLCEFHSDYIISKQLHETIIKEALKGLEGTQKTASHCCWVLLNLFSKSQVSRSMTSVQINYIFDSLIKVTMRQDAMNPEFDLLVASYSALNKILEELDESHQGFLLSKIQYFLDILERSSVTNSDNSDLQSHICSALHSIFGRTKDNSISDQDAKRFIEIIIALFKQKVTVIEEGLQALGTLAENIKSRFTPYVSTVQPFIVWSIENLSPSISKSGVMIAGDLSRAIEQDFDNYIREYIPKFLNILANDQVNFEVKVRTIETLADFASHSSRGFIGYLSEVLNYIESASGLSQNLELEQKNPDMHDFLLELREAIISFYVGIVQGMAESSDNNLVVGHLPRIIEYGITIVQDIYKPTINIHISFTGLIVDIVTLYGKKAARFLVTKQINDYLASLTSTNDETLSDLVKHAQERIKSID